MSHSTLKGSRSLEIKKHVNAIHCSNNLTLVQRKLFNALLFNAYYDLPYKSHFQIQTKELCRLIGYNSHDYGNLKKAILGLITIAIEWNVIDSTTGIEKQWKASSILTSAELSNGVCTYEYSSIMKEFLFQPEIYGRIDLNIVSKFKSSYGLALYENCIRYQGLSQTPWFPIEIFRKLMGVFGEKYIEFRNFKKRVLNIAINEINTLSPIHIAPEIERQNQKVTKIRFKLVKKDVSLDFQFKDVSTDEELVNTLSETFALSLQMINEILSKYEQKYIKEKIELIMQSESFLAGKIRGLSGYFIEALKKNYKASKSSKNIVEKYRQQKETIEKEKKEKENDMKLKYEKYLDKKLKSYLTSLSEIQYKTLLSEFDVNMMSLSSIFQQWYKKEGLEHHAIYAEFKNFLMNTRKNEIGEILTYADFVDLIDVTN